MGTYGSIMLGASRLAKIATLSKAAKQRLKWFDYYHRRGRNIARTCRYFGISRQTFYRWARRFDPENPSSLEDRSHRPHRVRQRSWSPELVAAVLRLREQYPRWGKDKLVVLLQQEGQPASPSTVGRILSDLKQRRLLLEPLRLVPASKQRPPRPYGVRKPKEYVASKPGDIVQVDTLDLRPLPGVVLKQLTARDVVSRWDVLEVHRQASARTTAGFLDALGARMPFEIKAIQVDGGSEFMAQFEQACQQRGIALFVLPPRSPKLNGCAVPASGVVERANRTHAESASGGYEVVDSDFTVADLAPKLLEWERVYNTIRPHQALGYLTPQRFLECYHQHNRKEVMCH